MKAGHLQRLANSKGTVAIAQQFESSGKQILFPVVIEIASDEPARHSTHGRGVHSESSVAIAQQDLNGSVHSSDCEIELSVAVEVCGGHRKRAEGLRVD